MGDRDWIDEMGEQVATVRRASESDAEKVARLERERDALAAQLAALREAALLVDRAEQAAGWRDPSGLADETMTALRATLADTAPAAEAYTRRVQAEALESAADDYAATLGNGDVPKMLRNRAAKMRGGR